MQHETEMNDGFEPESRPQRAPPLRTEDIIVPLVDEHEAGRIYDPTITRLGLWGALIGAVLLGVTGYAIAAGSLPIGGLGQWSGTGASGGAVTGTGVGLAIGGLAGALIALYRMPARRLHEQEDVSPSRGAADQSTQEAQSEDHEQK